MAFCRRGIGVLWLGLAPFVLGCQTGAGKDSSRERPADSREHDREAAAAAAAAQKAARSAALARPHRLTLLRSYTMGQPPLGSAADVDVEWTPETAKMTSRRWLGEASSDHCVRVVRSTSRAQFPKLYKSSPSVRNLSRAEHQRLSAWIEQRGAEDAMAEAPPAVGPGPGAEVLGDPMFYEREELDGIEAPSGLLDGLSGSAEPTCLSRFHTLEAYTHELAKSCAREDDCILVKFPDQILRPGGRFF